jgi:DNA-binding winged helix-turn-helix (wHTH) protein/TolB-like protein/tetratricopeptide (TPR) repeat protein
MYSFGPFQLDLRSQVLLRNGQTLPLKPKVFDVLVVLVENSGQVVCKDELMKQVWADSCVEEGNLTVSIFEIRKALGGDSNGQKYIETIPRRGYRFVARVTEANPHSVSQQGDGVGVGSAPSGSSGVSENQPGASKGTIAVLPFKSIGAKSDEYLGLGMADALITRLSNLRKVTVRPTSSVRKYTGVQDPVLAGRDLGVEWVLDGSVQKSGKRIRVTVQLVNVSDGALLWAEKFDETFTHIFAVEDSISEQVSKAFTPRLTGDEKRLLARRYTENALAYDAYLKGRYFFDKRTPEGCTTAIQYLEAAIKGDPKFALAYAGLADCYDWLRICNVLGSQEANLKTESAVLKALELDSELAEAHASLALLRTRQWDWLSAGIEFQRAIELNPNCSRTLSGYAIYLLEMDRPNEALTEIRKAQALNPLSLIVNATVASVLYFSRHYDEAIKQAYQTLELDEDFAVANVCLGFAYEAQGRYDDATSAYKRATKGLRNAPELLACLGRIDALAGRRNDALYAIDELTRLSSQRFVQSSFIALIYAALGDKDDALHWLEKAYAEHDTDLALLKVDPRWDGLRADRRFERLLRRVGLAHARRSS